MLIILKLLNSYKQEGGVFVALLSLKESIFHSYKHLLQSRACESISLLHGFKGSREVKRLRAFNQFLASC